jgi:hypothetical protein
LKRPKTRNGEPVAFLGSAKDLKPRTEGTFLLAYIAMNAVAKEGFEFAGMTPDEIGMRREVQ